MLTMADICTASQIHSLPSRISNHLKTILWAAPAPLTNQWAKEHNTFNMASFGPVVYLGETWDVDGFPMSFT